MTGTVLITGIGSFTGPYLTDELARGGYRVIGLAQSGMTGDPGAALTANLLDKEALQAAIDHCRPDYVIHLAAITFVPHGDIAEMYLTNVVGTRNLLEVLSRSGHSPQKVLLASSANVYGNATEGVLAEDAAFSPANDYAASKVAMEYMSAIWRDKLPIVVVRPFNYTGVGQSSKFLIPKIVSHFRERKTEIELGNTDVVRDFSDVRFVSAVYRQVLEKGRPGEAYNICSGRGYSLNEILSIMNTIAGYDIAVRVNPDFVRTNEVRQLIGSNRKILDLCPSLEVIPMKKTLNWMYSAASGPVVD